MGCRRRCGRTPRQAGGNARVRAQPSRVRGGGGIAGVRIALARTSELAVAFVELLLAAKLPVDHVVATVFVDEDGVHLAGDERGVGLERGAVRLAIGVVPVDEYRVLRAPRAPAVAVHLLVDPARSRAHERGALLVVLPLPDGKPVEIVLERRVALGAQAGATRAVLVPRVADGARGPLVVVEIGSGLQEPIVRGSLVKLAFLHHLECRFVGFEGGRVPRVNARDGARHSEVGVTFRFVDEIGVVMVSKGDPRVARVSVFQSQGFRVWRSRGCLDDVTFEGHLVCHCCNCFHPKKKGCTPRASQKPDQEMEKKQAAPLTTYLPMIFLFFILFSMIQYETSPEPCIFLFILFLFNAKGLA